MNLCKTCGTICPFDDERTECDVYAPMTNENWFISLPTKEKAKVFANATYSTAEAPLIILCGGKESEQKKWEMWLKQPHRKENEK